MVVWEDQRKLQGNISYNALCTGQYRIAGFFRGGNFHKFHELIAIRENFSLEIFTAGNQSGVV